MLRLMFIGLMPTGLMFIGLIHELCEALVKMLSLMSVGLMFIGLMSAGLMPTGCPPA